MSPAVLPHVERALDRPRPIGNVLANEAPEAIFGRAALRSEIHIVAELPRTSHIIRMILGSLCQSWADAVSSHSCTFSHAVIPLQHVKQRWMAVEWPSLRLRLLCS